MTYQTIQKTQEYTEVIHLLSNGKQKVLPSEIFHQVCFNLENISIEEMNSSYDKEGNTLFSLIAEEHHFNLLNFILTFKDKGLDVFVKNNQQENALMRAAHSGNLENIKILSTLGFNIEDKDNREKTAFLHSIHSGSFELMKYFIEKLKCDIEVFDYIGENAILYCAYWNMPNALDYLLKNTHLDINSVDKKGHNALHTAILDGGCHDAIEYLLHQTSIDIHAKTTDKDTSLSLAIRWKDTESFNLLIDCHYFKNQEDFHDFYSLPRIQKMLSNFQPNTYIKQIKALEEKVLLEQKISSENKQLKKIKI